MLFQKKRVKSVSEKIVLYYKIGKRKLSLLYRKTFPYKVSLELYLEAVDKVLDGIKEEIQILRDWSGLSKVSGDLLECFPSSSYAAFFPHRRVNSSKTFHICLIAVVRGGTIPTTLIDYQISKWISKNKSLATGEIKIHTLYVNMNTYKDKDVEDKESLLKLKRELNNLTKKIRRKSLDMVFVIDDLVDTGRTLRKIHKSLSSCIYFENPVQYVFLFIKDLKRLNEVKKKLNSVTHNYNIIIGKVLNTKKWLAFWYD
jgi:hypoxanthine phosphoribosyltransferase